MTKFVLATHNRHKAEEVQKILDALNIKIETLEDHGINDEIIEDGLTMSENAWIKANFVFEKLGGNIIADDSGLEVDALDGQPGLHSARYAGLHRNNDDNIDKLLKEMTGIENRSAQFRAVLAVYLEGEKLTFEGIVRGTIAEERIGTDGFGYDPIFIPDGYNTSFGVIPATIKNKISHRARALDQLRQHLRNN